MSVFASRYLHFIDVDAHNAPYRYNVNDIEDLEKAMQLVNNLRNAADSLENLVTDSLNAKINKDK